MATYLFPTTSLSYGVRPRNTYGTMYTDIVRASSDAIDALSLFRRLILDEDTSLASVGFSAYNAHVGDISCQLRACMLLDLTKKYNEWASSSRLPSWLDRYIKNLENVRDKARLMLGISTAYRYINPAFPLNFAF